MKSDIVKVSNTGDGIRAALSAASAAATYRNLEKKEALHLQLLAEEMLGMVRQITGETDADFWVESEGGKFELHLVAHPVVTGKMREELLKASSSGKNAAAKGFMGKLRDIFSRALSSGGAGFRSEYGAQGILMPGDLYMADPATYTASASIMTWSMSRYRTAVEDERAKNADAEEAWDELEKSIVANIADEVEIAITGDRVEMIVYKNFKK